MDFRKVRNSIDSVVMDYAIHRITSEDLVDNIVSILIVDEWDGTSSRFWDDLNRDLENPAYRRAYRLAQWNIVWRDRAVNTWRTLRRTLTRRDYTNTIELVRDLRGVFPGLSIAAAAWIVRGK